MSFENIRVTQSKIADRLSDEFEKKLIPQSVLISGRPYSSRMSTALELALTLTGKADKFYSLDTNSLIVLSDRDMDLRIKAALNLYKKQKNSRSLIFLLQTIKLFLLSFHVALSDSTSEELLTLAGQVSEVLYDANSDFTPEEADKWISALEKPLQALLQKNRKKGGFSIDNIRDISAFFQSSGDEESAVILENIENVTPGAMNSILKLLEEPPEKAHIILVSSNPGRILDTILSRVRKYELPPISENNAKAFLRDRFFSSASSLEEFFYTTSGFDYKRAKEEAENFIDTTVIERKSVDTATLTSLSQFLDEFSSYPLFFSLLTDYTEKLLYEGKIKTGVASRCNRVLSHSLNEAVVYNQNKRVLLDRISRELINE